MDAPGGRMGVPRHPSSRASERERESERDRDEDARGRGAPQRAPFRALGGRPRRQICALLGGSWGGLGSRAPCGGGVQKAGAAGSLPCRVSGHGCQVRG
eukprot:scaffold2162_cov398-Prasinococcus_capsulatus_cf.AAC.19